MTEREIFEAVYLELRQNPLLTGRYDAVNGNKHFMYGVQTVMEAIAVRAGKNYYEDFSNEFIRNMIKSEEKAGIYDYE